MEPDISAAVSDLSSEDVFTRAQAVATLGRHPAEARALATAALGDASSSDVTRVAAALALGQIGDDGSRDAKTALRKALDDSAPAVRWAALGALGQLPDPLGGEAIAAQHSR